MLERADSASIGAQVARPALADRLRAVRATIDDATEYRAGAKNRPRNLLALLVVLFAGGGMIAFWLLNKSAEQEQLASQFRFFRLQSEATAQPLGSTEKARDPADDRELYAALDMGAELAQKTPTEEARVVLRNSIRSLERGARIALSDVSVRIVPASWSGGFTPAESDCAVVNAEDPRVLMSQRNLGIRLRRDELDGRVATVAMEAVWRAADGAVAAIEFVGPEWTNVAAGFAGLPVERRQLVLDVDAAGAKPERLAALFAADRLDPHGTGPGDAGRKVARGPTAAPASVHASELHQSGRRQQRIRRLAV